MRVLWVSHTGVIAGSERSLLAAIEHRPDGVEVVLAAPAGPLAERAVALGAVHREVPLFDVSFRPHPVDTPRGIAAMLRAGREIRRIVSRDRIDVIVGNTARAALAAVLVPQRVPVVGYTREHLPSGPAGRLAHAPILRRCAAIVANSHSTAGTLPAGRAPVRVIYNAVDRARFEQAASVSEAEVRRGLGVDDDTALLAVIAYLAPKKAQDDAIRSVAAMKTERPWQLLLVGEAMFPKGRFDADGYAAGLPRLAEELGVGDRVRLLGQREDVPELLRAIDVLLVPSWSEPFGRTVIEGMWSGCVVVAADTGGPPEVIRDGEDGILLPPRSPERWGRELGALLDDGERAERLATTAADALRSSFEPRRYAAAVMAVARAAAEGGPMPASEPARSGTPADPGPGRRPDRLGSGGP
ncbi:glycosyltransferase family 4 protein [Patulibacter medicamentivorans]|uniref:glycosyltransferase family 4 protein n=1 Tax=Patulibacter medicamentivorans TaxID=1097667 RepID=UPI00058F2803|nr:glycosyltransferase family 4 protein [Patulibacter medicamentivorans]